MIARAEGGEGAPCAMHPILRRLHHHQKHARSSGAAVATIPQIPHDRDSAWYSVSFQLPARPARMLASSFFCSGPTAERERQPRDAEQRQRPADPERAQQRADARCSASATPVATMSSTPGTVNQRSLP